jgi:hypothetical protein
MDLNEHYRRTQMKIKKYLSNCFLLLIPLFLWNIILVDYLPKPYSPEIFWKDIPKLIGYSENILRIIVFALPVIMIFSIKTRLQKIGLGIYLVGILIYFMSWTMMIIYPQSNWSTSLFGFMAPAFTTLIFFIGIGLIGNKAYFKIPYLFLIYITLSALFVIFHSLHTFIIFERIH